MLNKLLNIDCEEYPILGSPFYSMRKLRKSGSTALRRISILSGEVEGFTTLETTALMGEQVLRDILILPRGYIPIILLCALQII
jgi:hypothetical protein